jgi:C4-dicarboxylate transporter, DctQ subunit
MIREETGARPSNRLSAFLDLLNDISSFLAGVLMVGVMLFVTLSVLLRYVLNRPIGWSVEVSEYSLVCITFLLAAWVLRREGHVRVDLVLAYFSPASQALLNTITSGISTIVCLVLTFFAAKVTLELYGGSYFTPTILMIPKFIFILIMTFGLLLLTLQFIRRTHKYLHEWRTLRSEN